MGRGGSASDVAPRKSFGWPEVQTHTKKDDQWLVLNGEVYDVTNWSKRHPGGSRLLAHYAGQDASEAFNAFHTNTELVRKYLKPLHVGTLEQYKQNEIAKDFAEVREAAKKMGLFNPSYTFFALMLLHIVLLEVLAYQVIANFGPGWIPFIAAILIQSTYQAQVGWLQHDFGHISVFKSSKWNHILHYITMGVILGTSPKWWNHMHYQHHAKPNVMGKDPDVHIEKLFVVGDVMPVEVAKKGEKTVPFNQQHKYFFALGPPLLYPIYFQLTSFIHMFRRKLWLDLVIVVFLCYGRFMLMYTPHVGFGWMIFMYFSMRTVQSNWFTWVSQANHIPMTIRKDESNPWLKLQMHATCNIEKSFFNDWFTGHLNFQIEHHLFPTMPRHNLYKITPLVKSLCEKHHVPYIVKPIGEAFSDIVRSLKTSGALWEETFRELHTD